MASVHELQKLLKQKDDRISQLEKLLEQREQRIQELSSQLDKYQSVLNQTTTQPGRRKQRGIGISAEPQTLKAMKETKQTVHKKYSKSFGYVAFSCFPTFKF